LSRCQLRALQSNRRRGLQLAKRFEQPRQRREAAGDLINSAECFGDSTSLAQFSSACLKITEKRTVHAQGPSRVALLLKSTQLLGYRQRLLAQFAGFPVAALRHQRLTERGQHLSALWPHRVRRHKAYGLFILPNCAVATARIEVAAQECMQQAGPYGVTGLINRGQSRSGQGDGTGGIAREVGRLGRVPKYGATVVAKPLFGLGNLIP